MSAKKKPYSKPYCTILNPNVCSKAGFTCNSNSDCSSSAYCRKVAGQPNTCRANGDVRNIPAGQYCDSAAQCASGLCEGWLCRARTPACSILDPNKCNGGKSECDYDGQCAKDSYCRKVAGQPNTCRLSGNAKNVPVGQYCDKTSQCASGPNGPANCENYICTARTAACNILDPTLCNKGASECDNNYQCATNAYCRKVAGQPNTCRIQGTATNVKSGDYCDTASQCKGGYCNSWVCSDSPPPCGFTNIGACFEDIKLGAYFLVAFVLFWYLGIPLISLIGGMISSKSK
jgi:hypothetical protein